MTVVQDDVLLVWAKSNPYHSLLFHMIDVGNVARTLISSTSFHIVQNKFSEATGCPYEHSVAWLAYIAAMHDLGKCDPDFQIKGGEDLVLPLVNSGCMFNNSSYPGFRHEARSAKWMRNHLKNNFGWNTKPANTIADAIKAHHSKPDAHAYSEIPEIQKCWEEYRERISQNIQEVFNPPKWQPENFIDHSEAGIIISGLIVLSDWIASNNKLFTWSNELIDIYEYAKISREKAEKATRSLGFFDEVIWPSNARFTDIWKAEQFKNPRPLQIKCEELYYNYPGPGLIIIEAPMGEGKTEAALYLASRWMADGKCSGLYVALPTSATSNQMYSRVKSFLNTHDCDASKNVRLAHGTAWIQDDVDVIPDDTPKFTDNRSEELEAYDWFLPKKRSLLSPYAVGTIDQALMSVLNVKFGFLRLFGLSSKTLIIDEVHAYDAYMSCILKLLLMWCSTLKIPVILLSATLPSDKKSELLKAYSFRKNNEYEDVANKYSAYPLITISCEHSPPIEEVVQGASRSKRILLKKYEGLLGTPEGIANLALDVSSSGGCVCVLVNTVDIAQKVFEILNKKSEGYQLFLFHSRFKAQRRDVIEKQVLSLFGKNSLLLETDPEKTMRPTKAILIATQVVEQSLDLDFDVMITEMAPIDLLLQRAGRLHRHERHTRLTGTDAVLHIALPGPGHPDFKSSGKVYDNRYIMLMSLYALRPLNYLDIPNDIPNLVELVYCNYLWTKDDFKDDHITKDDLKESHQEMKKRIKQEEDLSGIYRIEKPKPTIFETMMDRSFLYSEDEGDSRSYFNAKTRIGNETMSTIVLGADEYQEMLSKDTIPEKESLKKLYLNKVDLPDWWLLGLIPEPGYCNLEKGPIWLKDHFILRLNNGVWRGRASDGKQISIYDNDKLGLTREEKSKEVEIGVI